MRKSNLCGAWQFGIALGLVLAFTSPAPAFYWSLRVVPSLVTPSDNPANPPTPGADPLPLPPDTPVPGGGGSVPEPASAAAALIGLLALGARRVIRSRM